MQNCHTPHAAEDATRLVVYTGGMYTVGGTYLGVHGRHTTGCTREAYSRCTWEERLSAQRSLGFLRKEEALCAEVSRLPRKEERLSAQRSLGFP